jgi:hypothetical protein
MRRCAGRFREKRPIAMNSRTPCAGRRTWIIPHLFAPGVAAGVGAGVSLTPPAPRDHRDASRWTVTTAARRVSASSLGSDLWLIQKHHLGPFLPQTVMRSKAESAAVGSSGNDHFASILEKPDIAPLILRFSSIRRKVEFCVEEVRRIQPSSITSSPRQDLCCRVYLPYPHVGAMSKGHSRVSIAGRTRNA